MKKIDVARKIKKVNAIHRFIQKTGIIGRKFLKEDKTAFLALFCEVNDNRNKRESQ